MRAREAGGLQSGKKKGKRMYVLESRIVFVAKVSSVRAPYKKIAGRGRGMFQKSRALRRESLLVFEDAMVRKDPCAELRFLHKRSLALAAQRSSALVDKLPKLTRGPKTQRNPPGEGHLSRRGPKRRNLLTKAHAAVFCKGGRNRWPIWPGPRRASSSKLLGFRPPGGRDRSCY